MNKFSNYLEELKLLKTDKKGTIHWTPSDSYQGKYSNSDIQDRVDNETIITLNQLENDKEFYKWKVLVWKEVISIIKKYKLKDDFTVIDICCGNGFLLHMVKKDFPKCKALGVDLFPFTSWVDTIKMHDDINFVQMDVDYFIKVNPEFKFDIGMTFNTLRGWEKNKVFDVDASTLETNYSPNYIDPRNSLRSWLIMNSVNQLTNYNDGGISWK